MTLIERDEYEQKIGVGRAHSKIILIGSMRWFMVIRYCFALHHIEVISDRPSRQSMDFV